jgi:diadenosine tetraphosphatase ApaH/serine/threonine PP2A family protein phosphatase
MRIAVVSDVHSNLVALDAVLAHAGPVDAVWHLGDIVGYGPDPDGVVARLAQVGAVGVRGNHDAAAIGGDEIEQFNPEARAAMDWTRAAISEPTRAWLAALPERRAEADVTLVHGSPRDPTWEYLTSPAAARASFGYLETTHGLNGHTHIPLAFVLQDDRIEAVRPAPGDRLDLAGRRAIANPGSVGQPRDGDPRASYLILDPDTGTVTWHRVAYAIETVQDAMAASGLPPRLAARLAHGV